MADNMAKMEARIRELEAQRANGKSVPELDALYSKMDAMTQKAHKEVSKYPTGEMPSPPPPVKKAGGGSVKSASSRADGCCTKGKTKGRMV
jgi:hypothetical protein